MVTKDELIEAIEEARRRAELAERSAHRTQGPYRKPTVENIKAVQETLDKVLQ